MSTDDPAIITCAISGAIANRDQCPAIPYTPEEYAAEARRIVDEGGVHIHIHARTPDGAPSYEVEDFAAIRDAIRAEVGDAAIINFSTGTVGVPVEKRIAYLEACRPEVAALNMGSMNYAKYSRSRSDFVFKFVFTNPFDEIIELLEAMRRLQHQARARVLRPRPRRVAGAAGRHGPARGAAARRLRHGGGRAACPRRPATCRRWPTTCRTGRTIPPLGRDRDRPRPVEDGRGGAHPRRVDPGRAGGQLLSARR